MLRSFKEKMLTPSFLTLGICLAIWAASLFFPGLLFTQQGGCPPNDTCPEGWMPVPVNCWSSYCDEFNVNGYCILCKKAEEQM